MLGNNHFYNRTIRKVVVAFGTLFNDIYLQRYSKDGSTKYEIFKVPLSYGPKEKYLTRITTDSDLNKSVSVIVPRISFEMTGMSYDSSRKQQSLLRNFSKDTDGSINAQYVPVPYDFSFSMSIYVRNTEDGTQIVEQILPFFTPDFTVTVDFIPDMNQKYDLPVILNSVSTSTDYEGDMLTTRLITWDLEFTVKGWIWPAVIKPGGLIGAAYANTSAVGGISYGSVYTNIYMDTQNRDAQKVYVDYANGNNVFSTAETVRIQGSNNTGKVVYFSNTSNGILIVGELTELIKANDVIIGDYTNATYTVLSVDSSPVKALQIQTKPVPQSSDPDDEYGFSEIITEWPNTL